MAAGPQAPTPTPTPDFQSDDCSLFKLRVSGPGVRCGNVSVPLRHGDAASPRIRLAVVVIEASDAARRQPDPLFIAQGGPGGSTIGSFAQMLADDPARRPTPDRDLVLWDQRGTYFSQPRLLCRELTQLPAGASDERQKEAYRQCGQRLAREVGDLSAFNSVENTRDIDAVRAALGYGRFNFYGVSYGTELGQLLMRERPDGLRSVVLDAVVPLGFSLVTDVPAVKQKVMQELARSCEESPPCRAAYPDLARRYLALIDRLDREPVVLRGAASAPSRASASASASQAPPAGRADGVVTLSGRDLDRALYQSVYMREAVPLIPYVVQRAEQGDFSFALNFAELMRTAQSDMADAMYMSVVCAESGDAGDEALRFPGVLKRLADEGRDDAREILALCRDWNIRLLDKALLQPVRSDVPTLLLSGRFDPITPPSQAERVASGLSRAHAFTFAGGTHGQAFTTDCANRMIAAFLSDPSKAPDGACAQASPMRFVTPDQVIRLPGRAKGAGATPLDHAAALAAPALAVVAALALLFSAVPVYSVSEVVRIFRSRSLDVPAGWRGRLIVAAPWIPVFAGFVLLAFIGTAAASIAQAVKGNQLLLLVGVLPSWIGGLGWMLVPFVLAMLLMTAAAVELWRHGARSLAGRLYYTLLVAGGWLVCVALLLTRLSGTPG